MTGFRLDPLLNKFFQRILGMPWDEVVALSNDPRFLAGVIPSGNLITTARGVATLYQCLLDKCLPHVILFHYTSLSSTAWLWVYDGKTWPEVRASRYFSTSRPGGKDTRRFVGNATCV
jgi:hypothetical protein